jgi:Uma2 family endonuclease
MIETKEKKKLTVEEFMKLPDVNIELIDGQIVSEPTPLYGHQKISLSIAAEIFIQLKRSNKGEIVTAPMDVFIGGDLVVQPDLLFITREKENIIRDGKIQGVPDVVFEIISPSNAFHDTKVKFDIYQQFGIKEYFIVYPDDKTVVKYVLTDGKYHEQYREIGLVKSEIMGCEINF